jgi:hypothetical protein
MLLGVKRNWYQTWIPTGGRNGTALKWLQLSGRVQVQAWVLVQVPEKLGELHVARGR